MLLASFCFLETLNVPVLRLYSVLLFIFHFTICNGSNPIKESELHVSDHPLHSNCRNCCLSPSSAVHFHRPTSTASPKNITFNSSRLEIAARPETFDILLDVYRSSLQFSAKAIVVEEVFRFIWDFCFDAKLCPPKICAEIS